jgi:hypothetical protein
MLYEVVCTVSGDVLNTFDNPKSAAAYAKLTKTERGHPARIISKADETSNEWHDREEARFASGEYELLPDWWYQQDWWKESKDIHQHHYVHWSTKDHEAFAFTASIEQGIADKQTRISPSRYLSRYFGHRLRSEQISAIVSALLGRGTLTLSFKRKDFVFAYEEQEVMHESSTSPSCMSHPACEFDSDGHHPAEAYSTYQGEFVEPYPLHALAIAYVVNKDEDVDCVLARCVVWPAQKTRSRLYGRSEQDRAHLGRLLDEAGYRYCDNFNGAHMAAISLSHVEGDEDEEDEDYCSGSAYLMPYLDGEKIVYLDGGVFNIGRPPESFTGATGQADNTSGHIILKQPRFCPRLQSYQSADNFAPVVVRFGSSGERVYEHWSYLARVRHAINAYDAMTEWYDVYCTTAFEVRSVILPHCNYIETVIVRDKTFFEDYVYLEEEGIWVAPEKKHHIYKVWRPSLNRVVQVYLPLKPGPDYMQCSCGIYFERHYLKDQGNSGGCVGAQVKPRFGYYTCSQSDGEGE